MPAEDQDKAPPVDVTVDSGPVAPGPHGESWLPIALDFGPLLIFFIASKFGGMFAGTGAFMAAIVVAVLVSKARLGRVSPMLWLSAILVLFFGGLTLYLKDQRFIQIKPTIIYAFFALMLLGGWLRGKPLLRYLLQAAYDGLDEAGWLKLSRNWGLFFVALALVNEVMRANLSFDTWLTIKVWGVTVATLIFGAVNLPMLLKHGLKIEPKDSEK